jgi:hypothetical protein
MAALAEQVILYLQAPTVLQVAWVVQAVCIMLLAHLAVMAAYLMEPRTLTVVKAAVDKQPTPLKAEVEAEQQDTLAAVQLAAFPVEMAALVPAVVAVAEEVLTVHVTAVAAVVV